VPKQRVRAARTHKHRRWRVLAGRALRWFLLVAAAFYALAALALIALRWINPPFTMVHVERRIESWFHKGKYRKRYTFVPLERIAPDFRHAVIAAEDSRFYQHGGFDWKEVQNALEDSIEEGKVRGASTIDEQLVKNLFFSTSRSLFRKGIEVTLVPIEELVLSKQRILELYLNVVEWGPGVYGAEAAARYHYRVSAAAISRDQAARLAAILPAPRRRKPQRMNEYSARILDRMDKMGW
jgi:monofunctional biosynthetic peptidoglycan transglycosylase